MNNGNFLKARPRHVPASVEPLLAEAFSIREALAWLNGEGMVNVIMEINCLYLFNNIKSQHHLIELES